MRLIVLLELPKVEVFLEYFGGVSWNQKAIVVGGCWIHIYGCNWFVEVFEKYIGGFGT